MVFFSMIFHDQWLKGKYVRIGTDEYYTLLMQNFQELHEGGNIKFKVMFLSAEKLKESKEKGGLLVKLGLVSKISTRNMSLTYPTNGVVVKFDSAEQSKLYLELISQRVNFQSIFPHQVSCLLCHFVQCNDSSCILHHPIGY